MTAEELAIQNWENEGGALQRLPQVIDTTVDPISLQAQGDESPTNIRHSTVGVASVF